MTILRSAVLLSSLKRVFLVRGVLKISHRTFSTAHTPNTSILSPRPLVMSEADFHVSADALLASLETSLCTIEDELEGGDISLAMGVLTIKLGTREGSTSTFVLNKQTPTRQVWWSSPLSGPRRFEFDIPQSGWFDAKNGANLRNELSNELMKITGKKVIF